MAQLVLPSQLRGRPPAPGSRRGLVRFQPVMDNVQAFTDASTRRPLGDVTLRCESPNSRLSSTYTTRPPAESAYETCVRDPKVYTAELRDNGSLIRARYLAQPAIAAAPAASSPVVTMSAPQVSSSSARAGMSTGAKVAIGVGVVGALYLFTRKGRR